MLNFLQFSEKDLERDTMEMLLLQTPLKPLEAAIMILLVLLLGVNLLASFPLIKICS